MGPSFDARGAESADKLRPSEHAKASPKRLGAPRS